MPGVPVDLTISVVVPTYQRRDLLPDLLQSLTADPDVHEVVVVVDGSTDGSVELLERMAAEEPRLRPVIQENRGLAAARQRGLEEATGDVVLVLDDDIVPQVGLAGAHLAVHRERWDPQLVLVGHMPNDPSAVPRERRAIAEIYARAYGEATAGWEAGADVLLHFWAGHFSLWRDAALALGFLTASDVEFRRQEDLDFGMRAATAGYRGAFDRRLGSMHLFDRTIAAWRRECFASGQHRSHLAVIHEGLLGRPALPDHDTVRPSRRLAKPWRRPIRVVARSPLAWTAVEIVARAHAVAAAVPGLGGVARFLAHGVCALETQRGAAHYERQAKSAMAAAR